LAEKIKNVSVATKYEIDNSFDSEKFIKLRFRVMHDGLNPNKSSFGLDVIDNAKESIKNIPILANVVEDENGEKQFGGHDAAIVEDEMNEGSFRIKYYEQPIGIIPETNNYEIREFNGRNYVMVDGYVFKDYSNYAEDIIERDEEIKISMEIMADAYEFNEQDDYFDILGYRYTAITMLNKEFDTGMIDANAEKLDFNADDSRKNQYLKLASELKFELENLNKNDVKNDIDVSFLGGEEGMDKNKEMNKDVNTENQNTDEMFSKTFEISHDDIRTILYGLLAPIENEDNEWYFISEVYDGYFDYSSWGQKDSCFRQAYTKTEEDSVVFDGERVTMFVKKLTQEQLDTLAEQEAALTSLQNDFDTQAEELAELKEFKQDIEEQVSTQAKDGLYEKFGKLLNEEEIANVKELDLPLEEIEFKLSALVVAKQFQNLEAKTVETKEEVFTSENLNNKSEKAKSKYAV